jgi:hypothetical protein
MLQNTEYSYLITHKTHLETSGILHTCQIIKNTGLGACKGTQVSHRNKKSDYTTTIGQIRGITHVENLNFLSEVSFGTQLIKV